VKADRFEDLLVWQKSKELAIRIFKLFEQSKNYSFRDQIQRAVVSISNNIAEGFERKGNKELKHFLFIAKGSCGEVRSMLYLCLELNYITKEEFDILLNEALTISKMLSAFIKTL
jgi:four helix bundle protein